jgi:hypothetical protein
VLFLPYASDEEQMDTAESNDSDQVFEMLDPDANGKAHEQPQSDHEASPNPGPSGRKKRHITDSEANPTEEDRGHVHPTVPPANPDRQFYSDAQGSYGFSNRTVGMGTSLYSYYSSTFILLLVRCGHSRRYH